MLRRRKCFVCLGIIVALAITFTLQYPLAIDEAKPDLSRRETQFPLVWKHIHQSAEHGGAWYIPPDWLPPAANRPTNITDAAQLAAKVANSEPARHLSYSTIPRLVHQTWKTTNIESLSDGALEGIESWLEHAMRPGNHNMAYFMWDNEGIKDLVNQATPEFRHYYNLLPQPVERADIFRILVCNLIGGVYADVDTRPLRHPFDWVEETDVTPWVDTETGRSFGSSDNSSQPVGLILGIEADVREDSDSFWRMGYSYPVQLTQWALASSANQPVMSRFLENFEQRMRETISVFSSTKPAAVRRRDSDLVDMDPLELTGPVAITRATKDYLAENVGLRWQALSGLDDGGRSKLVLDTLILPITGFSPGRGIYGNMGSKPFSHSDARLRHDAQGSWKRPDLTVEIGKICRTLLGRCRYWPKYTYHDSIEDF